MVFKYPVRAQTLQRPLQTSILCLFKYSLTVHELMINYKSNFLFHLLSLFRYALKFDPVFFFFFPFYNHFIRSYSPASFLSLLCLTNFNYIHIQIFQPTIQ